MKTWLAKWLLGRDGAEQAALDAIAAQVARLETATAASFRTVNKQLRNAERRAVLQLPHHDHPAEVQERVLAIGRLLKPTEARDADMARFGNSNDGGYVQLDSLLGVSAVVSLGISDDVSWDLDMADRGMTVCQYDHSVEGPPVAHEKFRFHKLKVAPHSGPGSVTLGEIIAAAKGPDGHVLLKMDLEGSEWEVLDDTPAEVLARCSQIVCELHHFHHLHIDRHYERVKRVLEKLSGIFGVVHVHSNNVTPIIVLGNVPFFQTLEITFANRSLFGLRQTQKIFPTALDAPNNPTLADHFLGRFDFG